MRKVIVYIATSADGFIARLDGSVDWLERPRPKGNYGMGVFYKSIDTILGNHKRDSSEHKPPLLRLHSLRINIGTCHH